MLRVGCLDNGWLNDQPIATAASTGLHEKNENINGRKERQTKLHNFECAPWRPQAVKTLSNNCIPKFHSARLHYGLLHSTTDKVLLYPS